jgi:hypothetical protein
MMLRPDLLTGLPVSLTFSPEAAILPAQESERVLPSTILTLLDLAELWSSARLPFLRNK